MIKFQSYSEKDKSYILFYDLDEKKQKLLTNEYLTIVDNDKILEPYIISAYSNDDYFFTLNSEKIVQKWDCAEHTCIQKINITFTNNIDLKQMNLIYINEDLTNIIIEKKGIFYYFKEEGQNLTEGLKVKIDDEDNGLCVYYTISNNNKDRLLVYKNKKFYVLGI